MRSNLVLHMQCSTDHSTLVSDIEKAQKNHTRKQSQFVTVAEKQTKESSSRSNFRYLLFPICSVHLLSFIVPNKA